MAVAVVTVAAGGLPVVDVTATTPKLGTPVTEATSGLAVTKVTLPRGGLPVTFVVEAGGSASAEATAFLARTSGLDATHSNAYTALINGLVADGVWAKLDVLHVYATQNTATAQLNLISASYPATLNGSPTFTVDRGYTGSAGATVYIDTGFNPATAGSPKFVQSSGHLSVWSLTNVQSIISAIGSLALGNTVNSLIYTRYSDDNTYTRINGPNSGGGGANANSIGHFIASRTAASVTNGYKNGASFISDVSSGSSPVFNGNMYALGINQNGVPAGTAQQEAMSSIGSGLTSTEAGNFYTRLRTYMTAVGVP